MSTMASNWSRSLVCAAFAFLVAIAVAQATPEATTSESLRAEIRNLRAQVLDPPFSDTIPGEGLRRIWSYRMAVTAVAGWRESARGLADAKVRDDVVSALSALSGELWNAHAKATDAVSLARRPLKDLSVTLGAFDPQRKSWSVKVEGAAPGFAYSGSVEYSIRNAVDLDAERKKVEAWAASGSLKAELEYGYEPLPDADIVSVILQAFRLYGGETKTLLLERGKPSVIYGIRMSDPEQRLELPRLLIQSNPSGASVRDGEGKSLGITPLRLRPDLGEQRYVVTWEGVPRRWQTLTVTARPGDDLALTANRPPFMEMVQVEGGSFVMGAKNNDKDPVHPVTLSSFQIGTYEVTQWQYREVMGSSPSQFSSGDDASQRPVERVSWYDAVEFCNLLSKKEGLQPVYTITDRNPATGYPITAAVVAVNFTKNGYRLPTEAEWEYAARGGSKSYGYVYSGSNSLDRVAWGDDTRHPVGLKDANELGLYDMSGDVSEWCQDWYGNYESVAQTDPTGAPSGSWRVIRGYSVKGRNFGEGKMQYGWYGFRVVRRTGKEAPISSAVASAAVSARTGLERLLATPGTLVMIDPNLKYPRYGWRGVRRVDVGVIRRAEADGSLLVDFGARKGWKAVSGEVQPFIEPGAAVVRGQDYEYGSGYDDGYIGTLPDESGWLQVVWTRTGESDRYRWGTDGKYDIQILRRASGRQEESAARLVVVPGTLVTVDNPAGTPVYGWGSILPGALGIIRVVDADGAVRVDFPAQKGWLARPEELRAVGGIVAMVPVQGGSFTMGSAAGSASERPSRMVTLSSFSIGAFEVTQDQYRQAMGYNPSKFTTGNGAGNRPVESVSWYDAVEFCNRLSKKEWLQPVYTITDRTPASGYPITSATVVTDTAKNGFRLPTEAEWEYAARGGRFSTSRSFAGSDTIMDVAWHGANAAKSTHEAGVKASNELGLFDMSGNVLEWCQDWYGKYGAAAEIDPPGATQGMAKVIRGGAWNVIPRDCRTVARIGTAPGRGVDSIGFRVLRQTEPAGKPFTDSAVATGISRPEEGSPGEEPSVTSLPEQIRKVASIPGQFRPIEMVAVEGGRFMMGPNSALDGYPAHQVTISSFQIGTYKVTQKQYLQVMGSNPSRASRSGSGPDVPVHIVSWIEAALFCNALSEIEGFQKVYSIDGKQVREDLTRNGYRLPTEAEWEYAARGGNLSKGYKYAGSDDIDEVAWRYSGEKLQPVGTKSPNELGLYDMSGNVAEWCQDLYGPSMGDNRVLRGGNFRGGDNEALVTWRGWFEGPEVGCGYAGFRVARRPIPPLEPASVSSSQALIPKAPANQSAVYSIGDTGIVEIVATGRVTARPEVLAGTVETNDEFTVVYTIDTALLPESLPGRFVNGAITKLTILHNAVVYEDTLPLQVSEIGIGNYGEPGDIHFNAAPVLFFPIGDAYLRQVFLTANSTGVDKAQLRETFNESLLRGDYSELSIGVTLSDGHNVSNIELTIESTSKVKFEEFLNIGKK